LVYAVSAIAFVSAIAVFVVIAFVRVDASGDGVDFGVIQWFGFA
jgi:hypothetical protein